MKLVKTEILDFLNRVSVKGMVESFVIEEDGLVAASIEKHFITLGQTLVFKGFGRRVGISNVGLLLKMLNALEASDNLVNIEVNGAEMLLATRGGKFTFKLSDADTIASLKDKVEGIKKLRDGLAVNLLLSVDVVSMIKKAVGVLGAGEKDTVSLFASDGKISLIIQDEATKSTASVDLGDTKEDFKINFSADRIKQVLDMADAEGLRLHAEKEKPMILESGKGAYIYMISFLETGK